MARPCGLRFDVATALFRGKRDTQEDAIVADFPIGSGIGVAVLADGMGGHGSGDTASAIVVTEVFSELRLAVPALRRDPKLIPQRLRAAAKSANACLRAHGKVHPQARGMGATLVALVQIDDALFWISVGDSLLFLVRDGQVRRLNDDHSLAPQFDSLVASGMIPEALGRGHPDRGVLTSALQGDPIRRIDCPDRPLRLLPGDIVLAASDGILSLDTSRLTAVLCEADPVSSAEQAGRVLAEIARLDLPDQDNLCFAVIRAGAHDARLATHVCARDGHNPAKGADHGAAT